jgi:hypothetical protein
MALHATQATPHGQEPPGSPLGELLGRLADELHTATGLADDCQAAVGEILAQSLHHEAALRLQALDMLTQQLSDISRVLEGLSQSAPLVAPDLIDNVRLADLQRRLRGEDAVGADTDDEFW